MDKIFGPGYGGDPGVPHSHPALFETIFKGSLFISLHTAIDPYHWQNTRMFNWHDWAMVCENHEMKQARKRNRTPDFEWNNMMNKTQRQAYFYNWPVYFP